ncbi:MAG: threonine synthase [Bacteroides sp.]|nr:MAG: threonine synthase [Bacteroides sp.]
MIKFVSIYKKNQDVKYSFKEAVLNPLGPDNELLIPEIIHKIDHEFISKIDKYNLQEIFLYISNIFLDGSIPYYDLKKIINNSINFPLNLKKLDKNLFCFELFHGPTLAFKDFGARFLAKIISYLNNDCITTIVSATSGDTGSAVADGFYQLKNTQVFLLYPSNKISFIQEKQLTTLNENIHAIEVDGTFDDCQAMLKGILKDKQLTNKYNITTANSINIARILPQVCYYFYAYSLIKDKSKDIVISIPSGNYGNLTAGIMAYKMGLPIKKFIASSNINDVVPIYLRTGNFIPKKSQLTISNAMDVGNPSNFIRIIDLFNYNLDEIKKVINGYSFTDLETIKAIKFVYKKYKYILDPHSSIGFLGLEKYNNIGNYNINNIFFSTAHYSKFKDLIDNYLNIKIEIPERLLKCINKEKKSIKIDTNIASFINAIKKISII